MFLSLLACSTASIDDGAALGPFTQVKTSFTSAFVANTEDGVVLVDAGYEPDAGGVEELLEGWGLELDDVAHVFITHGHTDHTRALPAYPNASVWAHELEVDRVLEEGPESVEVTDTLVDGQVVSVGELDIETLHVPGHTEGNVVYLADGVLLTGDTAMLFRDGSIGPAPDRYHDDIEQAAAGLLELRDRLEPRRDEIVAIGFGHTAGTTDLEAFWSM